MSVSLPTRPLQRVGKVAAGDDVVERIAGADELGGIEAHVGQVLDVGHVLDGELGQEGLDGVGTLVEGLDRDVEQIVDAVGVVAGAADHGVGADGAFEVVARGVEPRVEIVVPRATDQEVVTETADEVVVAAAAEDQVVETAAGDDVIGAVFAGNEVLWALARRRSRR